MSEKSILERSAEMLTWIQREQRANGLGMVELDKVPDQHAVRFLLRKGDVFEPQQGMIKSVSELEPEGEVASAFPYHKLWVWRTPKPKKKGDVPEPYEFLSYSDWSVLPNVVAEALRGMGFSGAPFLYEGYSYRKMAGGALRRKMFGTHSKTALIAELKLMGQAEDELTVLEQKIQETLDACRGKSKEIIEAPVSAGIVYHPKDGSFSLKNTNAV
ncbi:hypothetical protein [Candidatus Bathycorpusculum sp.]|uniref:hypothetical protein n=1 Tax=Candidatus Bathycorpusculum sp. TaxID=2994959 RepID=UPI00281AB0F6|nr:hypothetical protein [Candidatus Termitimicrobium sp.]MCL2432474.1 hypothetical protein [Candidatus Termitimicrobium sp.]